MQRRNFLGGLAGILAAGAAPAIIHNAMKIHVRKSDIYLSNLCEEILNPMWDGPASEFAEFMKKNIALRDQAKRQMIDTSRGFHIYEIPLRPAAPLLFKPVLVPPERRVLRFA